MGIALQARSDLLPLSTRNLGARSPPAARRPACQLFVADSLCCLGYGIIQHAAVRMWLVCNADVYLPEPKCLTGGSGRKERRVTRGRVG